MKTTIELIDLHQEEQADFKIHQLSPAIEKVIGILKEDEHFLLGEIENVLYKIPFSDIFYIEVVDKKSFLYTEKQVYQSTDRLYQLEERLSYFDFIRVSKSMLLNVEAIKAISPLLSGRFEALLVNSEKVAISRKYVPALKKGLGMER
ncbi:LytTR family DNA-binding domain-containing protein [Enterococcus wangshanyuanii]|uniref:LytTR family transcriptional regulator n=1 Tax=Enterococcus wangshanyuanii TaxID=2005703 RepID=A0ABQ1P557_9ENTE|nr:LytTR family DNA-binding domain-containing protein [Enterococcus wangshanyuanii]GGC90505.1 LytTR family transcriptional regulator [Enterococcus wangshanyuanii]